MSMRSITISFVEKEDMESFANICIRFVPEDIAKIAVGVIKLSPF